MPGSAAGHLRHGGIALGRIHADAATPAWHEHPGTSFGSYRQPDMIIERKTLKMAGHELISTQFNDLEADPNGPQAAAPPTGAGARA